MTNEEIIFEIEYQGKDDYSNSTSTQVSEHLISIGKDNPEIVEGFHSLQKKYQELMKNIQKQAPRKKLEGKLRISGELI